MENFYATLYAALWFETGGLFDPKDPECVAGTNRKKCGTSGGALDHGGNTKFGIAQNAWPSVDIDSLTLEQASDIYLRGYWTPCQCAKMPDDIASYVFDISCGSGIRTAARILQRSLGVTDDGSIGPKTLLAATSGDKEIIMARMLDERLKFYGRIVERNADQVVFLPGWTRRANSFMDRVKIYRLLNA